MSTATRARRRAKPRVPRTPAKAKRHVNITPPTRASTRVPRTDGRTIDRRFT